VFCRFKAHGPLQLCKCCLIMTKSWPISGQQCTCAVQVHLIQTQTQPPRFAPAICKQILQLEADLAALLGQSLKLAAVLAEVADIWTGQARRDRGVLLLTYRSDVQALHEVQCIPYQNARVGTVRIKSMSDSGYGRSLHQCLPSDIPVGRITCNSWNSSCTCAMPGAVHVIQWNVD